MGGTWVSHFQGNLFREMQRYDMDKDLVTTRQSAFENNYFTMYTPGIYPTSLPDLYTQLTALRAGPSKAQPQGGWQAASFGLGPLRRRGWLRMSKDLPASAPTAWQRRDKEGRRGEVGRSFLPRSIRAD